MPESNWLYDIIIGNAIANMDFVKDVYIHKKIRTVIDGKDQKSIEADITIITNNNKLLLAEVTTQSDNSEITSEIANKCMNLKNSQVPYDKIMYFTSSTSEDFRDLGPFKARIFGLKHLYRLDDFVTYWIQNTVK